MPAGQGNRATKGTDTFSAGIDRLLFSESWRSLRKRCGKGVSPLARIGCLIPSESCRITGSAAEKVSVPL
jgi:hypothetical protein